MTLDQYLVQLTKLRQTYGGEVNVMQLNAMGGGVKKAGLPRIANVRKDNPRTLFNVGALDRDKGDRIVLLGMPAEMEKQQRKVTKAEAKRFEVMTDYNERLGRGRV